MAFGSYRNAAGRLGLERLPLSHSLQSHSVLLIVSLCRRLYRLLIDSSQKLIVFSDDALAAKFRGRPIRTVPGTEAFAQIKRWIADCDANHQCCSPTVPLPKTLLDVGLSDSESSIKVVHFSDGIVGRYTALSYLHERGIKSDEASPAIFQHESSTVDVTMLPRLFQDAIWLTRELGIKYIWIDAICMAHNRGTNLKRDSAAFASIYINATLTLAATGSRYGSEGLFPYRPTRPSIHVPHRASDGTSGNLWMQVLPLDKEVLLRKPYIEMTSEPLYKGVWAFQERVLSPRILHFASDQIYFECMVYFVSEDGLLLDDRYHTIHNIDPDTGLLRWFMLLRTYGQLNLVEATDKLPALANIARSYQAILNDEYVAGCWKKQLVESLCWQSLHCKPAGLHRAPSWSWASVDGIPGMQFHGRTWESLVTIHNTHVELEGLDPFGKVKEAWINLEAPLMPLTLAKSQDVTEHIFLRTKEGSEDGFHAGLDTIPRAYSASAETVRSLRLFALVLVEIRTLDSTTAKSGYGVSYRGIIVVPVDGSAEQLKRVGFFIASGEVLAPGNVSSHKKVITLV